MPKYRYYIPDHGSAPEDAFEIESVFDESCLIFIAEDAAVNYHRAHDGWEASWPIIFVLLSGDKELGRFTVERESVPQFTARALNAVPQVPGRCASTGAEAVVKSPVAGGEPLPRKTPVASPACGCIMEASEEGVRYIGCDGGLGCQDNWLTR